MEHIDIKKREKILKIYFFVLGILLAIWWPITHYFFSDFYHQILGFDIGTYPDNMVKMIGTCGILPVMLIFSMVKEPLKSKSNVIILLVFSFVLALTYIYLVLFSSFPKGEYLSAFLCFLFAISLSIIYPWKYKLQRE